MAKKILFITGSIRKNSFNRQLATEIGKIIGDCAKTLHLEYAGIPYMNQDTEFPEPEAVARVRKEVVEVDGIWFCTPEYNAAVPGILKNLLDWLSRPLILNDPKRHTAIGRKKATISGAGGNNQTKDSRANLKDILEFMSVEVIGGTGTGIALTLDERGSNKLDLSDENIALLKKQANVFCLIFN